MADKEHFAILKQGIEVRNGLRDENSEVRSDPAIKDFSEPDLGKPSFIGATSSMTTFRRRSFIVLIVVPGIFWLLQTNTSKRFSLRVAEASKVPPILEEVLLITNWNRESVRSQAR
ncbi:MAG: hypothetical protein JSU72_16065 [Deltaproteobacteria bacterium]|nr:MAG: hypothetical protein JSU72_16065 [Deltaproteobacteria bacterium]